MRAVLLQSAAGGSASDWLAGLIEPALSSLVGRRHARWTVRDRHEGHKVSPVPLPAFDSALQKATGADIAIASRKLIYHPLPSLATMQRRWPGLGRPTRQRQQATSAAETQMRQTTRGGAACDVQDEPGTQSFDTNKDRRWASSPANFEPPANGGLRTLPA